MSLLFSIRVTELLPVSERDFNSVYQKHVFCERLSICLCFGFSFESRIRDLIVLVQTRLPSDPVPYHIVMYVTM